MRKLSEEKLAKERERLLSMRKLEDELRAEGYTHILGVDEVGRGPLCGNVVTACCVLPVDCEILFLNDSKKLSEKKREELDLEIKEKALYYAYGSCTPAEIDDINILRATLKAMKDACESVYGQLIKHESCVNADPSQRLMIRPIVLVDGNRLIDGLKLPQRCLIKGDQNSQAIAAASILAKVKRDHEMYEYDKLYEGYGFARNKGYGTKEHIERLKEHGLTPIHRRSFLKNILSNIKNVEAEENGSDSKAAKPQDKLSKRELGRHYEELAGKILTHEGYELLEYNFDVGFAEIDIIAKDGETVSFTEVKYRKDTEHGLPSEAVDSEKQLKIRRAAELWLKNKGKQDDIPCRFDIIEIADKKYRLIKGAF